MRSHGFDSRIDVREPASPANVVPLSWEDLDPDEHKALRLLSLGPYPSIMPSMAKRLLERGLAYTREDGALRLTAAARHLIPGSLGSF
jgi:hypothetical protein